MFAGPNGSGKTTVKNGLLRPPEWFGIYINPDELEETIRTTGTLSLDPFDLTTSTDEIRQFFVSSPFLQSQQLHTAAQAIEYRNDQLDFTGLEMNSYYASVLSDFLRRKAIESSKSFAFETVMSSPDKVDLLRNARISGFRTYLYFVATEDPTINVRRVQFRVAKGGHNVPEDKIVSRYYRALSLLREAVCFTNRAFFFDTTDEAWYFAEITNGTDLDLKSDRIPNWFRPIWDQF